MSRRKSYKKQRDMADFEHLPFWQEAASLAPPRIADLSDIQLPLQILLSVFPNVFQTSLVAFLNYPLMFIDCIEGYCYVGTLHENGSVSPYHNMGLTALLDMHKFKQRFRIVIMRRYLQNIVTPVAHANLIIIDTDLHVVEWFEPYGLSQSNLYIKNWLEYQLPGYEVTTAPLVCPVGPQAKLAQGYDDGYCVLFSGWYLVYRMLHPELSSSTILVRMTSGTSHDVWNRLQKFYGYISYINEYMKQYIMMN